MNELTGNIWNLRKSESIVTITTNGFVTQAGECVMGRGIALEAKRRYPHIPALIGQYIRTYGNRPFNLGSGLASFPVKPVSIVYDGNSDTIVPHMQGKFNPGDIVPGWACVADIKLIRDSARKLAQMADKFNWTHVLLPRPGCGNGNLSWSKVKPALMRFLDDRFYCCTF